MEKVNETLRKIKEINRLIIKANKIKTNIDEDIILIRKRKYKLEKYLGLYENGN